MIKQRSRLCFNFCTSGNINFYRNLRLVTSKISLGQTKRRPKIGKALEIFCLGISAIFQGLLSDMNHKFCSNCKSILWLPFCYAKRFFGASRQKNGKLRKNQIATLFYRSTVCYNAKVSTKLINSSNSQQKTIKVPVSVYYAGLKKLHAA